MAFLAVNYCYKALHLNVCGSPGCASGFLWTVENNKNQSFPEIFRYCMFEIHCILFSATYFVPQPGCSTS